MDCPRCHFVQPEDIYCAQCGVEVEAYKVLQEQSIGSKILKSTILQGTALISVIFVIFLSFFFQPNKLIQKSSFFLSTKKPSETNIPPTSKKNLSAKAPTTLNSTTDTLLKKTATTTQLSAKTISLQKKGLSKISNESQALRNPSSKSKAAKKLSPTQQFLFQVQGYIAIGFLEAPNNFLSQLHENKKVKFLNAYYPKAVTLSSKLWEQEFVSQASFVTSISSKKIRATQIQNSNPISYDFLNGDYGLSMKVTTQPVKIENSQLTLPIHLQADMALPASDGEPIFGTLSFSSKYSLGNIIILQWDLPKRPAESKVAPLKIYNSNSFLRDETSLFITIQVN